MNLGKLLGAGKSFFGGRGVVSYREDKRVYLPKFNAEKNPFESKAAEKDSAPASEPKKNSAVISAPPVAAPAGRGTSKIPVFSAPRRIRPSSWAEKLNPFRAPAPPAPVLVNAVQTELSLDAVKVVQNDLSDADVEIVPAKSQVATLAEPRLMPTRQSLDVFGERQLEAA